MRAPATRSVRLGRRSGSRTDVARRIPGAAQVALWARLARGGGFGCACVFEDDVVFPRGFRRRFLEYWRSRDAGRGAWQLGAFVSRGDGGLIDHPRDGRAGWRDGLDVGVHAYCLSATFARDALARLTTAAADARGASRAVDLFLRQSLSHRGQRLVDAPTPDLDGRVPGNMGGIAFQAWPP